MTDYSFGDILLVLFPSVVKPVITTIEKSLVIKTLGKLQNEDQQSLRQSIAKIIG